MNDFKAISEITLNHIAELIEAEWKAENTDEAMGILNSQTSNVRSALLDRLSLACREALK